MSLIVESITSFFGNIGTNILNYGFSLFIKIIGLFFAPIQSIINTSGIDLHNFLNNAWNIFNVLTTNFLWVLDLLAIPYSLVVFIINAFYSMGLIWLASYVIKLVIKWWDAIV